ncbi:MAG: DNA primase [Nitrospirota bacterium]
MEVPGTQSYIPDEIVGKVKNRADIVEVIAGYLSLTKSGENYKGLCPFHSEKTPSFVVSPKKQIFHCFGCGTGGNIFHFMMKIDNLGFPEAVTCVGERYGITVSDKTRDHKKSPAQKERDLLYEANNVAMGYYQESLYDREIGCKSMEYLTKKRGLNTEIIQRFGLGYARNSWDGLFSHMVKRGWTPKDLELSGLILKRNDKNGYYDRFRNRVIFPIRDISGRVIGFGGRSLDDSLPKYINSPETPIYIKGKNLYCLDKAKEGVSRENGLIIVEGYFDAIRLHQEGLRNVVATLGTALTSSHLEMIKRFTQRVYLIFDPDPAGIKATIRTIGFFIDYDISAAVVSLPEGTDPDSFINRFGREKFDEALRGSKQIIDFAFYSMMKDIDSNEIDKKKTLLRAIIPLVLRIENSVEKTHYLRLIADRLGIEERFLMEDLHRTSKGVMAKNPEQNIEINPSRAPKDEEILVALMINNKFPAERIRGEVGTEDITHPGLRAIFRSILESTDLHNEVRLEYIIQQNMDDQEIISYLSKLSLSDIQIDYTNVEGNIRDCICRLRRRRLDKDIKNIDIEIKKAEEERNYTSLRRLQEVKMKKLKIDYSRS